MKRTGRLLGIVAVVFSLVLFTVFTLGCGSQTKTITVLQTSDVHGMLLPYDYIADRETSTSLAQAATVIARERKADPHLLLIDSGDVTQGNGVHKLRNEIPHPSIHALNFLKYDAWILGNHEFNYDYDSLYKAINEFQGVTLAGNMYKEDKRVFDAYHIFEVNGIKVAIIGLTAPHIPIWESGNTEHYDSARFTTPDEELDKILDELEGKADVLIADVHYGPDGEYGEKGMYALAEKYSDRLDALLIGHSHSVIETSIAGIPVLEPGHQASHISKLALTLERQGGKWKIIDSNGILIDCSKEEPDKVFADEMSPYDSQLREMVNAPIGTIGETFLDSVELLPGLPFVLTDDNPLLDFVNKVQLSCTGADVACASLTKADANLEKGDYCERNSSVLYPYENNICLLSVSGKQLKAILEEFAGKPFQTYKQGDVTVAFDPSIRMYLFDQFAGIEYEIDITQPVGQRIKNIMYHGAPLEDTETIKLATNSYRFGMYVEMKLVTENQLIYEAQALRDCISDYVKALEDPIMPECDHNWRIVGTTFDDPQKELIFDMVRNGQLTIPASNDGRTLAVAALNGNELRQKGILP